MRLARRAEKGVVGQDEIGERREENGDSRVADQSGTLGRVLTE